MSTPAVTPDPYASIAVPISAQGDPYASIAKPLPPAPPAPQSLWEKAKANFNANTQGAQHTPGESNLQRLKVDVQNFGAGGGDVLRSLAHPLDTIGKAASDTMDDLSNGILPGGGAAVRMAQGFIQNPARAAGQVGTGMILGKMAAPVVDPIMGAVPKVADAALNAGSKVADSVAAKVSNPYPTSQSIVPKVSAARNIAKALVITPEAAPNFIRAATDEAGTIVGYAKDNNLPINSKVDFANAAEGAAKTVQNHFDSLLEPNAKEIVAVPASYRGPTVGEGPNATLGAVNDRIDAISSELRSNFRKPLAGQTATANTSDADLIAEKGALTNLLHNKLATATGLDPSDIAAVRQQAGKLRSIADEATLSANRDTTGAGKQAMGTTTSAVGTKAGLIDRGLQIVQGGPEIIGNREILRALQKVEPQSLNLPQPTSTGVAPPTIARAPVSGGPSTVISGPDYTPDPSAANLARERFIATRRLREVTAPQPSVRTPLQGESTTIQGPDYTADPNAAAMLRDKITARQTAPLKQMQKFANDGAVKLMSHDSTLTASDVDALNKTPAGKQILIRASGLTPGSPAMENLFPQIRAVLSHN